MKRFLYYFILAVTALAVVALLGIAIGIAILRPNANYVSSGLVTFIIPDCMLSAFYLIIAAFVCFVGSFLLWILNYSEKDDWKEEDTV